MFMATSDFIVSSPLAKTRSKLARGSEFSSYGTELSKMTSHFELLTRKCLQKFSFRVTNLTF